MVIPFTMLGNADFLKMHGKKLICFASFIFILNLWVKMLNFNVEIELRQKHRV